MTFVLEISTAEPNYWKWPHLMRDGRVRDAPMRDMPALVGRTGDVRTGERTRKLSHPCLFLFVSFLFPLSCLLPAFLSFSSRFASSSSLSFRST